MPGQPLQHLDQGVHVGLREPFRAEIQLLQRAPALVDLLGRKRQQRAPHRRQVTLKKRRWDKETERRKDGRMDGRTDGWKDGRMDRRKDGRIGGRAGGGTDGRRD